jgi:hypothetical protein
MSKMGINSIDIEKLTNAILNNDDSKKDDPKKDDPKKDDPKKDKKKDVKEKIVDAKDNTIDNSKDNSKDNVIEDRITIQTRDIHKFLYELWNQREINIVINLYKEMENKQAGTERDYIYNNIMNYCQMKENKVYKYIEDNSSIL